MEAFSLIKQTIYFKWPPRNLFLPSTLDIFGMFENRGESSALTNKLAVSCDVTYSRGSIRKRQRCISVSALSGRCSACLTSWLTRSRVLFCWRRSEPLTGMVAWSLWNTLKGQQRCHLYNSTGPLHVFKSVKIKGCYARDKGQIVVIYIDNVQSWQLWQFWQCTIITRFNKKMFFHS